MNSLLVHSDMRGFDFTSLKSLINDPNLKKKMIESAFSQIEDHAEGRRIYLPAFNYDFTKSLVFNPKTDLPQVGQIPTAATDRQGWFRSSTPVYSFLSNKEFNESYNRPFSQESVFKELERDKGEVLLIGVGFERLTLLHYVEHLVKVPYRYDKTFNGVVVDGASRIPFCVSFHVRPRGLAIDYDFRKIRKSLFDAGAAREISSRIISVSIPLAVEALQNSLNSDPCTYLTSDSRLVTDEKLSNLGRPFRIEDFE